MFEATPKCGQHNRALELIRVDISPDKIVTDVYGCPFPGCKTELLIQQGRRTVGSEKQEVVNGSHGTTDSLQQRRSGPHSH